MSMALKIVKAPATTPVSLDDAKKHLRVDFPDDDDLITAYIAAATEYVDGPRGFLGRALIDQTWDYFLDALPLVGWWDCAAALPLPLPPLIEVVEVATIAADGTETAWPPENYLVDTASEPGRIIPTKGWPAPLYGAPHAVMRVRLRAGYLGPPPEPPTTGDPPAAVPSPIKTAILLHVGDLYRTRETTVLGERMLQLPWAAEQLLRPHRFYLPMA
jgi:uncharacterized phiE125 gp8 family phage protein